MFYNKIVNSSVREVNVTTDPQNIKAKADKIKRENNSTIIVENFNISCLIIGRTIRPKMHQR